MSGTAVAADSLTLNAAKQPLKIALIEHPSGQRARIWTYNELERGANRLARSLLSFGVRPGERVLWCGMNSPGAVTMIHAARKAGVTAVPLNYRLTPEEAAYVVHDSDAVLAWIDADHVGLFESIRPHIPQVREIVVFGGNGGALPAGMVSAESFVSGAGDDPLPLPAVQPRTMIYTSGTTGRPKGAVRIGTGDPEQLGAMVQHIGYRPDEVYITTGPLYHSGPGGFMSIAYLLGHTVVLQRKFDPEDWLRLVDRYRCTSTFSAPTPIRAITSLPSELKARYVRSSLRVMIANAAPWPFALKQAYLADFPADSLFEVYGSTEMGVNMILRPEDQLRKPGSCGKPAPLIEVLLYDDDGNLVTEPRRPGEVFVRSRSMYDTYHKSPEKYEADRRGDFHTVGDVAYFDEEGFYYICDRKRDMVISGGMNIYPAEVEAALESHPDVYEAAVFGIPSEEWGELVHAAVVPQLGTTLTVDQVVAHARAHLASYKVPRSVAFLPELPKTGSGKVLKRELREPYWAGRASRV
ncbi:MAG TPA: AMP-binding protein [Thermoanaerobaculia bacterium]|nr:AMP-binding protein [Thermoanaerobaculia bacterium]